MKLHKYSDTTFSLYNFMSAKECTAQIQMTEEIGYTPATINDGLSHTLVSNVRNNQRVIHDDPALAQTLWSRILPFIVNEYDGWEAISLNERFRYYKYDKYQTFKWHRDLSFKRHATEMSKRTFLIYLNNNFEGGFTDFETFKVWPEQGMAVCFNHKLRHEGAIVSRGTKYVLRSDIMYRAK